jgi:hypothetical protein
VEIVLRTETPEGIEVALPAIRYAKILEEHPEAADLGLIDRTIRWPDLRQPDPLPCREQFFRDDGRRMIRVVVDFAEIPAIIVTAFDELSDQ